MDIFLQQILNGLVLGSIYALIALGYTMVYGIMGLINFAHGEVVMFGAMVTISIIGMLTGMGLSLPGPVVVLLALMLAIPVHADGFAIERIALPPAAQCAASGPADHRHRPVHCVAERRHPHLGPQLHSLSAAVAARPDQCPGASITDLQVFIVISAIAIMAGLLFMVEKPSWAAPCAPPAKTRQWLA